MRTDLGAGVNGARIGSLIGAVGGLVFVLVNAGPGAAGLVQRVLGVALFVATVVLTLRADRLGDGTARTPEQMRAYWWIVLAEVVAIPVGATVLTRLGVEDAGLPWVSIVLGLHFVGFAKVFPGGGFLLLGTVTTVLGVAGLVLALGGADRTTIGLVAGVATGFALLAGSLRGVWLGRRPQATGATS